MTATVVIPVRNDAAGLRRVLAALSRQTISPDEIIIVNAGDHPLSLDKGVAPSARVLAAGPALPGAARNLGASAARHPWIAFLDAGTQPVPGWLEAFKDAAATDPEAEILFGTYEPRIVDDWDWSAVATYVAPPAEPTGGRYPTTASICVRRDAWDLIGGMREDLRAGEDLLFFQAISARGLPTRVVPGARVRWDLPRGPAGHFRRLCRYSRATWETSLARRWQLPVLRMYLVGLVVLFCAFTVNPLIATLLPVLGIARLTRNLIRRRRCLRCPLESHQWVKVIAMALLADAASLIGVFAGVLRRTRSPKQPDAES